MPIIDRGVLIEAIDLGAAKVLVHTPDGQQMVCGITQWLNGVDRPVLSHFQASRFKFEVVDGERACQYVGTLEGLGDPVVVQ